jgi:UDP-N-acetyl-D-galactosamine dehydrogenase
VHDSHADPAEALHEYGIPLVSDALERRYDLVLLAVPHREYLALGPEALRALAAPGGTLADLKGELGTAADWTL